ncbi:MAG: cation:proton antiporter [Spirochaetes bacterium]|nr:cation:proton antiporter [Spirochaetota bacterium]
MQNLLLINITLIFAVSIPVLFFFLKLRLPSILGFLITGLVLGPFGLGLIQTIREVEILAEIGVVLLLFTIGIEFSVSNLQRIIRSVLVAGTFQLVVTTAVMFLIALALGYTGKKSLFFGFLAVLSSTAIVFKLLQERAELGSPHGMTTAAILIFQDLMVVPLILIVPYLSDAPVSGGMAVWLTLARAAGLVAVMLVSAKWIIPILLYFTVKTRSRELFLLVITVICLATAWLTHAAGLSPALGAFMAGLIISASEYSHEAIGNIIPFKDIFTGLFFVSVGMLVDVRIVAKYPVLIPALIAGVLLIKALIAGASVIVLGYPARTALLTGLYLAQVGEFPFILAKLGLDSGIIAGIEYQLFLIVVVVTMGLTPFLMMGGPPLAAALVKLPFFNGTGKKETPETDVKAKMYDGHLIIVGYGINGKNVARAARFAGIEYVIIEMNADTVKREKEAGENIFFGDATHEAVLEHAGIHAAKVMVVAIADHAATLRITKAARSINGSLYIIIRTRFFQDVGTIYGLGADEVIPEEYETSIEIFSRVLSRYMVPHQDIEKLVLEVRSDGYEMFRSLSVVKGDMKSLNVPLPDVEVSRLAVCEGSPLARTTLGSSMLRSGYGVTVLAVQRGEHVISNPGRDTELLPGDRLYVLGSRAEIAGIGARLSAEGSCRAEE